MSNNQFALDIVVDGKVLPQFVHEGKSYVAAELGKNFSLRVSVPRFGRFEGVLSVDGLDVLTGDTAKTAAGGYVFTSATTPDDNDITGFRLNDKTVAKFIFVERGGSYAELTHRPANVGVIGAVFYEEVVERIGRPFAPGGTLGSARRGGASRGGAASTFEADTKGGHSAGTGFGEVADSRVTMTRFRRGREVARFILEYDTREQLIKAGIIKPAPLGDVDPFPGDFEKPVITGCQPPKGWRGWKD